MRFLVIFLSLNLLFAAPLCWAIPPEVLCNQDLLEDLEGFQKDKIQEVCSQAGQYEDSLLPDQNATTSGKFREGKTATYDYADFFKSFTKSLGSIHRGEKCEPQKDSDTRVAYPSLNLEKTAAGTIPVSVVSEEELNKIFDEFSKDPKYAFDIPENGCWARAHLMARELEKRGIRVAKMFVEGTLVVQTKKALNGEGVVWTYHVAPMVAVQTAKGVEMRILDPSLFEKPVPVKTWTDKMLPAPELKEDVQIYVTDRFVLDPLRGESMKSIKEDPSRGRWHMAEVVMAEQELEERRMDSEDRKEWRQKKLIPSFEQGAFSQ
ncbi:MAG: hypothetical protein KUL82_02225 [Bdellovibrio sp.]|nr:hypothetical protein [Bdellovibrio sp.]